MKKLLSNKRLTIAIIAILLVVVFATFQWCRTVLWHKEVLDLCNLDNSCGELGNLASLYELPFKKILLFSGIVFSSAFLLLQALRNKE
jgi:hypothetical protein